jgi:hypothetical protein
MTIGEIRDTIRKWTEAFEQREAWSTLLLSIVIGAMVGLVVVAFILLTGRLAARMYPPGIWCKLYEDVRSAVERILGSVRRRAQPPRCLEQFWVCPAAFPF